MKMKSLAAFGLALVLAAPAAWAQEVSGKVQKVDKDQKMVVLEDGTELWIAEGVSLDVITEGAQVKVMYEEKDGKKWVKGVEKVN